MGAVSKIRTALARCIPELTLSNGTIEAKIVDVVGTYADSEALERQNTLDVIQNALATQKVTSVEYYRRKAVAFQYGDNLVYDPINFGAYYAQVDDEKRIIKQAYIVGEFPDYVMFVNKIGDDGHLQKLNDEEIASFRTYFSAFQPLGLDLHIASYDPSIITDTSLVIYVHDGVDANKVATNINEKFKELESVLRNTNVVTVTEISDVIQSVSGVVAVSFGNLRATEMGIDGGLRVVYPVAGLFNLTAGVFRFGTEVTVNMIKTLQ